MIDKRDIWKKCGDNPLYPQAGTWLIDRAYWCPGHLQQPDVFDLPVTNSTEHTIDINMEPYVTADPSANERISAYLIQYKKPEAEHDVAVEDIIVPTGSKKHLRKNPSCVNPVIVIRNMGSKPLTQCVVEYGTAGFERRRYVWKGELLFNRHAAIELPGGIQGKVGKNTFSISLADSAQWASPDDLPAVGVFPTRTRGKTTMDYFGNSPQKVTVQFVADPGGQVIEEHIYEALKEGVFTYDLSYRPAQRYYLKVYAGDKLVFNKRVRVGE